MIFMGPFQFGIFDDSVIPLANVCWCVAQPEAVPRAPFKYSGAVRHPHVPDAQSVPRCVPDQGRVETACSCCCWAADARYLYSSPW